MKRIPAPRLREDSLRGNDERGEAEIARMEIEQQGQEVAPPPYSPSLNFRLASRKASA